MMTRVLLLIVFVVVTTGAKAQNFATFFEDKTLRMDYIHAGNSSSETYYFDRLIEEPYYAGSKINLIDTNNFGNQYLKVYDTASNELIYSRGFCVLFTEWSYTPQAQIMSKAYPESVVMPYPKKSVRIELHSRNKKGEFEKKFEYITDPQSFYIQKPQYALHTFEVHYTGAAANRLDVVLLPEGYGVDEKEKFKADCKKFADEIFKYSPFKENAERFNIRGVWQPSLDSGVTIPGENEWRRTATSAQFYTLNSERYIMVDDFQNVRDIAGNAPYDLIYILTNTQTNTQKYGGGGIYNFYGISSANHPKSTGTVYVHEFGHLLLGLGDEYVGGVTINDMYPEGVEPWELNLTRRVDFEKNKKSWSDMISKSTTVPTPANKENRATVGIYEGGGYLDKGIYRPWVNCMMNSLTDSEFCPVCTKGINDMITFICK